MFGIGMPELIIILAVALIVIGPKKLPDLAKSLGRALGEFKKATNDLKDSISMDDDIKDVKNTIDTLKDDHHTSMSKIIDDGQKEENSSPASESMSESDPKSSLEINSEKEYLHDRPNKVPKEVKMTSDEPNAKSESSATDAFKRETKNSTS
jgi:sec-independent protein translocase protein TatB